MKGLECGLRMQNGRIYIFNQNWIVKNSRKTAIFLKIMMLCK